MKKSWIILLVFMLFFNVIGGCGLFSKPEQPENKGNISIRATIPEYYHKNTHPENLLDEIVLKKMVFTIGKGGASLNKTVLIDDPEDEVHAIFEGIAPGTWQVTVDAVCEDGYPIFTKNKYSTVLAGSTTVVYIDLELSPGHLLLEMVIPDNENIDSGKVTLLGEEDEDDIEKTFSATPGTTKEVDMGQVKARTWSMKGELYNIGGSLLISGQDQISILPGRTTKAEVHFTDEAPGRLKIIIKWDLPPAKPQNVRAVFHNNAIKISWNAVNGAIGYIVIRSLTDRGQGTSLTHELITETMIVDDFDFQTGITYWYRVVAYNASRLSSHFSNPVSITIDPLYSISGTVKDGGGEGISDVTISFTGDFDPVITDEVGHFSKNDLRGTVTVTPSKEGYRFNPLYRAVTGECHDVNFIEFMGNNSLSGTIAIDHQWPTSIVETQKVPTPLRIKEMKRESTIEDYVPSEIIVSFYPLTPDEEKKKVFHNLQATVSDYLKPLNAYLLTVPEDREGIMISSALKNPSVIYAELNYRAKTFSTTVPTDNFYHYQWHYPQIRLPQAWNTTTGATWVRIAVLDTGVNVGHPDLGTMVDTASGYNFVDNNQNFNDVHGHGTHVAGTIGADTNNTIGVAGVMWETSIIPVKVLSDEGSGTFFDIAQGIYYAAGLLDNPSLTNPAHIINMSLGASSPSSTLEEALRAADGAGVILVAASGNDNGPISYPARYPECIAVGSVDYNYPNAPERAYYSNYGSELDLVAPGGDVTRDSDGNGYGDGILSTAVNEDGSYSYSFYQGTSMAAPHVAGVIGLMLAAGVDPAEVLDVLHRTSIDLGGEGFDQSYGHGLINAYWAVNAVEEIKIVVGERQGHAFEAVAEGVIGVRDLSFSISSIPSGQYRAYAWIDVKGNGVIEAGDYLAQSEPIEFGEEEEYSIDLTLVEILD